MSAAQHHACDGNSFACAGIGIGKSSRSAAKVGIYSGQTCNERGRYGYTRNSGCSVCIIYLIAHSRKEVEFFTGI